MATLASAAVLYLVAVLVATYPQIQFLTSRFPGSSSDPLQHLWVMRWYRSCLLAGRAPWVCPDIQFPIGAHIGSFSPLLLQSLLFLPLSLVIANDVLCYNLVWIAAFLFTGLSTLILAWNVVAHRPAAVLAGLAAMLSTPVMMRSLCHLELMCVGAVPLFLAAWLRWLERPSRRGLLACVALYGLVTASAAYFAIYAIVPAALLVGYEVVRRGRTPGLDWLRRRRTGLAGFALLSLVVQAALFTPQIRARLQAVSPGRTAQEFQTSGVPLWGYALPSSLHRLHGLFPVDAYEATGHPMFTGCGYVGVVVLLLLHHAAVRRVRFPRAGYWWSALALMALLSMGSHLTIGAWRIPLPAWGLWHLFPPLRQTRDPARFSLITVCLAAVVAAAAYRSWSARWPKRWQQRGLFGLSALLIVLDLGPPAYGLRESIAPVPPAYRWIAARDPGARLLEAPLYDTSSDSLLQASAAYWQSHHGLTTSAGYSGFANGRFDSLMVHDSPLGAWELGRLDLRGDRTHQRIGLLQEVDLADQVWLQLTQHGFDYLVWHHWLPRPGAEAQARVCRLLAAASVFADDRMQVFERARLPRPTRPVLRHGAGWRSSYAFNRPLSAVEPRAELVVYSPETADPTPIVLAIEARAFRKPRQVRLRAGTQVVAEWSIAADEAASYRTPPLVLPPGLHTLVLESDGAEAPGVEKQIPPGDPRPFSLLATALRLEASDGAPVFATTPPQP